MDVLKQFVKAGFSVYFALTRIAQVVLAVIILGLDAFVIAEYDKLTSPNPNVNSVDLTSIFGGGDGYDIDIDDAIDDIIGNIRRRQFGGWDIPDFPGNTPFKAFVMFTTIFTLIVVVYAAVSGWISKSLTNKTYHIYGETALEFILAIFWLTSFAGVAQHVTTDWFEAAGSHGPVWYDCLKAIAGLAALAFAITAANFVFLVIYSIRWSRSKVETPAAERELESGPTAVPGYVEK